MDEIPKTLAGLLLGAPDGDSARTVLEAHVLPDVSTTPTGLPGLEWSAVSGEIAEAVRASLDVKLTDILTGAWTKLQELQEYLDANQHPPKEIGLVPLVRHSVRSTHHPAVEILHGDEVVVTLAFDVDLSLDIEGAVLKVQAGQILEIVSASFECSGHLKYGPVELASARTERYSLPGRIRFKAGIPIPRHSEIAQPT